MAEIFRMFDNDIPDPEATHIMRICLDAGAMKGFLEDREYAPDMKRRLIYERIKYIRESMNQWISMVENNSEIDHNFVFREDNAVSTDDI